jgi:Holliday junction resolvase RusA-like endonuclease
VIKLRLSLPCPVNRRFIPITFTKKLKSGKKFTGAVQALSKEYRQKQMRLVAEVWKALGGRPEAIPGPVQVFMVMTPRDKRTADCDAYFKAVLDGLVKANVLKDDKQVVQCSNERLPNPQHPGFIDLEVHEVPV